jgi:hypothetical protein
MVMICIKIIVLVTHFGEVKIHLAVHHFGVKDMLIKIHPLQAKNQLWNFQLFHMDQMIFIALAH